MEYNILFFYNRPIVVCFRFSPFVSDGGKSERTAKVTIAVCKYI